MAGFTVWRLPSGDRVAVYTHRGAEPPGWLRGLLEEVYTRLPGPGLVEVHVYPDTRAALEAVAALAAEAGAAAPTGFEAAMHEAWSGLPRIHLAARDLEALGRDTAAAMAGHEAIHAALHGSLEYYLLPPWAGSVEAYYIAATTVKDLEAHLEAERRGLGWIPRSLARYWGPPPRGCPRTATELLDTLRHATLHLALHGEPPGTGCPRLHPPLQALHRLALGPERPWKRRRLLYTVLEALIGGP